MARITSAGDGLEQNPISGGKETIRNTLERAFEDTRTDRDAVILRKLVDDYLDEIHLAARVAKAQFGSSFGGQEPSSDNEFAMTRIQARYFGADGWDYFPALTGGAVDGWIEESSPDHITGTAGEPITIGSKAVHIVCGIGSYHDSPKITAARPTLNDKPKANVLTEEEFRNSDMKIKWFDAAVLLNEGDEVLWEVFSPVAGNDEPYLEGISFIDGRFARELDPADIVVDTEGDTTQVVGQ